MDMLLAKVKNFWYYYKFPVLIGVAVVAVWAWLSFQSAGTPEADYHIGLVRADACSEAELDALKARFAAAGEDRNGDGQVLVQIHTYFVDLADDSPNAGVNNAQTVSSLDADLIGKVSGIFLLEDVITFRQITPDILEPVSPYFDQGLYFALRKDADSAYKTLAENLF